MSYAINLPIDRVFNKKKYIRDCSTDKSMQHFYRFSERQMPQSAVKHNNIGAGSH